MKLSDDKKQTIRLYILEKIEQGDPSVAQTVADTFGINASTVHAYINEMVDENIIEKVKRGQYEPVCTEYEYGLSRLDGELEDEMRVLEICLSECIRDYPKNVQGIWNYAFSEMANNVIDHSMAENAKVIVRQTYRSTKVILLDDGIGIFEKIQKHFSLLTLEDAICELFKGKLTTDTENHSGEGIFFSSRMMDSFYIISSGKVFTTNKFEDTSIMDLAGEGMPGTCVVMELSNFSQREAKEVFDIYASVEGGFTKTRIPLRNVFDTAPVSRSQAKRVCNRLDRFQEAVMDFEGVDWIGQGFAHQLFVVFQNSHPEMKLIPVNMNEDITKMYNHVTAP